MSGEAEAPTYDGTPRSIAVLKAAAKALQPYMSLAAQAERITAWSRENASRWQGVYAVSIDRRKWHRFVARDATYTSNERDLPLLAWNWFFEQHRYVIEPLWHTTPDQHVSVPNAVAPALHAFLSPSQKALDLPALELLRGDYAVYRPSFVNLDHIMLMSMTCGTDADPSRFKIEMAFLDDEDEPSTEQVEGFAIPYQDCILFQGRLRETGAPFIFVMSSFPIDPKSGGYSRGDGTLLVGARGTLSSAYPITMRRAARPIVPQTFDPERFKAEIRAHKEIMQFLGRGVVGWR